MATMNEKLKIYKAANATTYTADIYTTAEEALDSPIMVDVNGTTGYIAASTNPPAAVALPLYAEKDGVTYQAMETGYVSGEQTFTASGTFTVPAGVTKIYVTASAGGGGGGGAQIYYWGYPVIDDTVYGVKAKSGSSGGTTSLGDLLSLLGGGGGGAATYSNGTCRTGSNGTDRAANAISSSYGNGGSGGSRTAYTSKTPSADGGKGGRGANCSAQELSVTPGQVLAVTIGSGGSGGTGSKNDSTTNNNGTGGAGSAGQPGYMHIRW